MPWLADSDVGAAYGFARSIVGSRTEGELRRHALAALADAEDVEMRQSAAPEPPRTNGMTALGDGATYGVAGEPDDAIRAVVVPESGSPPTCA